MDRKVLSIFFAVRLFFSFHFLLQIFSVNCFLSHANHRWRYTSSFADVPRKNGLLKKYFIATETKKNIVSGKPFSISSARRQRFYAKDKKNSNDGKNIEKGNRSGNRKKAGLKSKSAGEKGDEERFYRNSVKVGVIGCGRIGQIHSQNLAFRIPGAVLHAISDPFENMSKNVLEATNGIPRYYEDYQDMLDDPELDAVVVASPTAFHVEQILACAKKKKHIFCEKPISNSNEEIALCNKICDENKVKLMLGFQRRFDPNFVEVKRTIDGGTLGDIRTIRIVSRDPSPPPVDYLKMSGGIMLDQASHDFDMVRFLTGREIEEVVMFGDAKEDVTKEVKDLDTCVTMIKTDNGIIGSIENSRRCSFGYDQRVEVFGSLGSVIGENRASTSVITSNKDGITTNKPYNFFLDRYYDAYQNAMVAFIEYLRGNEKELKLPLALDGEASLLAGKAAYLSYETNRPVRVSSTSLSRS